MMPLAKDRWEDKTIGHDAELGDHRRILYNIQLKFSGTIKILPLHSEKSAFQAQLLSHRPFRRFE
jgi:hypothetical protein